MKIIKSVLEKIKPSEKELNKIAGALEEFQSRLKPKLKAFNAKLFLGGSLAKRTLIKKTRYDIDIFVLFPYKYKDKSQNLSKLLEKALKAAHFKYSTLKGSRDYFQINLNNLIIELIPILKIKKAKDARNITDISPLHVYYILKKIKGNKNKNLSNEIKLAKAFCYTSGCYGAESYIQGFSGYALEVLVSHFGSFLNLMKKASKWQDKKIIIDPEKYYKTKEQVLEQLNESKKAGPLILIDPVQQERNVTAALSHETLARFVLACKKFLSKPSESFFFKQEIDIDKLRAKAKKAKANLVILKATSTKKKIDIVGAKLKKFFNFLLYKLKKENFSIIKTEIDFNEQNLEAIFYLIVKEPPKTIFVQGPPIKIDKKYLEAFKKRWKKAFVKKGKLYAKAKRKFANFQQFLNNLKKEPLKEMGIKEVKII
jgi:tRNA nucleotidyltransferase (CCA-adding enzyme)